MRRVTVGDLASGILVACAVVVTGLLIRRELRPAPVQASALERDVSEWRQYTTGGHRLGAVQAAVTIVEFSDFQCPFCRQSSRQLRAVLDSVPAIGHVFRHYPLSGAHPYAILAAVASECAARQGRFREYHDALFAQQDSIGKKQWSTIATESQVQDTSAFGRCMTDSASVMPRIRADMAAGSRLGVAGTPTLLVNGRLFSGLPTTDQLRALIDRASTGR